MNDQVSSKDKQTARTSASDQMMTMDTPIPTQKQLFEMANHTANDSIPPSLFPCESKHACKLQGMPLTKVTGHCYACKGKVHGIIYIHQDFSR
jgi:hypothetical protein